MLAAGAAGNGINVISLIPKNFQELVTFFNVKIFECEKIIKHF